VLVQFFHLFRQVGDIVGYFFGCGFFCGGFFWSAAGFFLLGDFNSDFNRFLSFSVNGDNLLSLYGLCHCVQRGPVGL